MSLSSEWTEWHLTPRGWETGSTLRDFGHRKDVEPPPDRVATFCYSEKMSTAFGGIQENCIELWSNGDRSMQKKLRVKFGECPDNL